MEIDDINEIPSFVIPVYRVVLQKSQIEVEAPSYADAIRHVNGCGRSLLDDIDDWDTTNWSECGALE